MRGHAELSLLLLTVLVLCARSAAVDDSTEDSYRDKRIFTILRRNNSCKLYGHSCLGGHGKRSDEPSGALPADYLQMLRRTAANEDEAALGVPPRGDRPSSLDRTLLQLLRNRLP
ncbi:uncharacterized protein LOC135383817 isoform X1 [Ornithodoros turicata]|uniref:uncharacterized protein LOC135383817 isoform X1 n=1 Tax=Ornithodoros turicata TaxID=34597 RepID=UPI003139A515